MPTLKIDGSEHEFPAGMNVLQACGQIGVYIPHFCYHPALSISGNCRMCKVEVVQGGRSRIDISCNVMVADGLEILTDTEGVRKARQMTLEYLLANHPVDCPICDDAGECDLQNFYMEYGRHDSRFHEIKKSKHKAHDIGRSIVLDSERCVLCSRCVRFLSEVTHTNELGIFGMGATEELIVRPGATVDNDYAGNIVDLCPVGALTDKDFRFKRRVWFLKETPSICQGCSRGCNVRIDFDINPFHGHKRTYQMKTHRTDPTEHARIQRIKPRTNPEVNGHWICDHGRYGYKETDSLNRLSNSMIADEGKLVQVDLSLALKQVADGLAKALKGGAGKVMVVASPQLMSEELFAVKALIRDKLNISNLDHRIPLDPDWYGDDLLRTPDPFPNRTACEWIGVVPGEKGVAIEELNEAISAGKIDTLLAILTDPAELIEASPLRKLKRKYAILRHMNERLSADMDVVLPAAAWGEYSGTFVNFNGRIQRLETAFDSLGDSQPVWKLLSQLSAIMKKPLGWKNYSEVFKAMSENVSDFSGLSWESIGSDGVSPLVIETEAVS